MNFTKPTHLRLALLLIVLNINFLIAQKREDKIYAFYQLSPATDLKDTLGSSQANTTYDIQIGAPPIPIGKRLKWINLVNFTTTNYQFEHLTEKYAKVSSSLFDGRYGAIFIYDLINPKWSLFAAPTVILRSDLNQINFKNSLFLSGVFLVNFNPDTKKRLVWSFGLAYANDFNRNVLIPIAGLTYNDDKFSIEIAYPRINLIFKPKPKIEWGLTASVIGGIYKIPDLVLPDNTTALYTQTINVQTGHTFNYLLSQRLVFNSCIGYSFIRNYDLMNEDFKPI